MNKKRLKEAAKYILRSYPVIKRYIDEVESLYAMTPDELRARNEKRFIELFRLAYAKSTFYYNLYSDAGIRIDDIKSLDDIKKLPVVTKEMIRKNPEALLTCGKMFLVTNHTSGTTGTPLTVYESWPAIWREQAYFYCYRKRCGFKYGDALVSLRGALGRNDTWMKVQVSNTLFLSSFNIKEETTDLFFEKIKEHKPKAIEGFPSALYNLALLFKDKGLKCDIPIAFTSSENMFDYQYDLIKKVFNCDIFDHFGTTERTIRLEEDLEHDGYYEDPGYGIEEYFDDCVISTSLINNAFPLIRYKQNDRIILKPQNHKGKSSILKIDGRAICYIVGKDGTQYSDSGLTFIFKDVEHVRKAQFVQKEVGKVILNIVTEKDYCKTDEDRILQLMEEKLGLDNIDLEINRIDESGLIYTNRNKLALVVNEMRSNW